MLKTTDGPFLNRQVGIVCGLENDGEIFGEKSTGANGENGGTDEPMVGLDGFEQFFAGCPFEDFRECGADGGECIGMDFGFTGEIRMDAIVGLEVGRRESGEVEFLNRAGDEGIVAVNELGAVFEFGRESEPIADAGFDRRGGRFPGENDSGDAVFGEGFEFADQHARTETTEFAPDRNQAEGLFGADPFDGDVHAIAGSGDEIETADLIALFPDEFERERLGPGREPGDKDPTGCGGIGREAEFLKG